MCASEDEASDLESRKDMEESKQGRPKRPNIVFVVSFGLILLLVLAAVFGGDAFSAISNNLLSFFEVDFGWLYLLAMFVFVIFAVVVGVSKYGKIKLGSDDSKPEYSTASWLAMLFCAGMGIGLVFWGVAEPISHYVNPTVGIEPATAQSAEFAMTSCFMHWGFQPWGAYAIIGLGLAYAHFRKGRPFLVSSIIIPVFRGSESKGIRRVIDIFAAIVTVAGVTTSLGLGCLQISAGLEHLFGIPSNTTTWFFVILIMCVIYSMSAVSGVSKGVKRLSSINAIAALGFAVICLIIGPTLFDLNLFVTSFGNYVQGFLKSSLDAFPFSDNSWLLSWRVFYWAWWIAWAPFVGMFIARISRGRTVREFVFGVVIVPALLSMMWFAVMGGMGLTFAEATPINVLQELVNAPENALFAVLDSTTLGAFLSVFVMVIIVIFFITSADSATYVLSVMSCDGDKAPSSWLKVMWGVLQALIAIALLVAGGIKALQTFSIAAAFPFIIIMLLACIGMIADFRRDVRLRVDRGNEEKTVCSEMTTV